jgi:hypothetical protein
MHQVHNKRNLKISYMQLVITIFFKCANPNDSSCVVLNSSFLLVPWTGFIM